jgi:hypothetical protein
MRPAVRRLRTTFEGRVDVVNVSTGMMRRKKIAAEAGIAFTPTFVFVRPDGKIHSMMVGDVDEERLAEELEQLAQVGTTAP